MDWLIGHLVGDFILQNDWMAVNKKHRLLPALVHCALYTLTVLLCAWWPLWTIPLVFSSHLLLDGTNFVVWFAKWKGSAAFTTAGGPYWPWSLVAIDNTLHLFSLWLISKFVEAMAYRGVF